LGKAPFFSVLTVTLDRAADLKRAIGSLQAQEERDFEHVVVDGGSSDATLALLKDPASQVTAWISEPDTGIADALNKAIGLARGEWIVLLHAGDELAPGALRHWKQMALQAGEAEILSCAIRYVDENGQPGMEYPPVPDEMPRRMAMPHPGMAVKRSLYGRIGMFRTDLRVAMDYEFTLRALHKGAKFRCDATVVSFMQMGGISQREPFRARNENFRARVRWLGLRPWMIAHYAREVTALARGRLDRFVAKLLK
jgi:glycosyltransferase involved in cell wall biosynthesis